MFKRRAKSMNDVEAKHGPLSVRIANGVEVIENRVQRLFMTHLVVGRLIADTQMHFEKLSSRVNLKLLRYIASFRHISL